MKINDEHEICTRTAKGVCISSSFVLLSLSFVLARPLCRGQHAVRVDAVVPQVGARGVVGPPIHHQRRAQRLERRNRQQAHAARVLLGLTIDKKKKKKKKKKRKEGTRGTRRRKKEKEESKKKKKKK